MRKRALSHSAFCILHSALLLLAIVRPCAAQKSPAGQHLKHLPPEVSRQLAAHSYGRQTDAFRRLLFELHFQPLQDFKQLQANPSESVFLMLGDPSCLSESHFPKGLHAFVEQGGAVLIATDMRTEGAARKNLNDLAGVVVSGEKLVCDVIPNDLYQDSAYCPYVQPIGAAGSSSGSTDVAGNLAAITGIGSRPALFQDPRSAENKLRVATNAPSWLKLSGWWLPLGVHRLAQLPNGCVDEARTSRSGPARKMFRQPKRHQQTEAKELLFAVGGSVGKGRLLILADHSIFINRMMLPSDNGNLEFAANCLHWLRGGVSTPMEALRAANSSDPLKQLTGQRNKVLFWDDDHKIRTDFEVPLKPVPLKPSFASEPAIVAAVDKTLARMEDNDYFNRQILDSMDGLPGGRKRVLRYAVYLLTLAAFLFLGYRFLWQSRHRPEPAVPLLAEALRRDEPRMSLLDQRRRALLRSGNVWEIVHRLAQESFESAGVPLTAAAPRLEMKHGSWWQRWRVNRRVARLWKLARGDTPMTIPPAALKRWLRELEMLKSALRDGTIR